MQNEMDFTLFAYKHLISTLQSQGRTATARQGGRERTEIRDQMSEVGKRENKLAKLRFHSTFDIIEAV